jgi:PKD domain
MRKLVAGLIAAAFAASIAGASPAMASTDAFQVKAVFLSATCQGGDFANVKLTALLRGGTGTINYRWDFTNNGSFDTAPSTDPATSHLYGDELTFTARVGAKDGSGATAFSTISFSTPRCP